MSELRNSMERIMKLFNLLMGIFLLSFACSVSPTTINGRFSVIQLDSTRISVLLKINTNSGSDDLGGTTMVFRFDTTAISFPSNPQNETDYSFHNFSNGNYSAATVTRPLKNQVWINIDLPNVSNNNGTEVASDPEWTDVVTIIFDVVDPSRSPSLSWFTSSPFWGVYDADNSTLWETGEFEDFPTSVEEGQEKLPTSFELSQNYPNPFNPSTRIKFTVPAGRIINSVHVRLKVYDILGNEVATLVDEEKSPGIYEVEFSSFNRSSTIASGIYIYSIQSGNFVDTKKMVLLK